MELKTITVETANAVATITLNRPDRLNAWTNRMAAEYGWALDAADSDPAVRVVVVTGAGRGFCGGADMAAVEKVQQSGGYGEGEAASAPSPHRLRHRPGGTYPHTMAVAVDKPVIAAINGAVAGIGLVLACSADLRFAAAGAKFTTSFARLGLNAEYGVSWLLSRIVGTSRAADLLFSSRILYAEEAYRIGLVNEVFASDDLLVETMAYAQRLATEVSPRALAEIKRQLVADQARGLDESIADAVVTMERLTREPDFIEGTAAFAEKRAPSFAPLP